jgi:thiol-disulfide isomerase/thioredoxin
MFRYLRVEGTVKTIGQLLLILMLAAFPLSQPVVAGEVLQANLGREGQAVNPKSLIVPGRPVVVDFFSPYCPPCQILAPRLERLAAKTNVVVMKVNINRPGIQGIDWQSPAAQQFGLKTVPYLVLFDPQGKMIAEGQQAIEIIERQMKEVGVDSQASPVQRAFETLAPAPTPALGHTQAREIETSPPSIATVRKAKQAQGLKGYIFQDRNSGKWFLEDREGDNYKFEGGQWVKIGGQEQPVKSDDRMQAAEPAPAVAPAGEAEAGPPTIATVRKAKKNQGLEGYIFQDRNSGKWFLDDGENTYKFDGGQWVKIK